MYTQENIWNDIYQNDHGDRYLWEMKSEGYFHLLDMKVFIISL